MAMQQPPSGTDSVDSPADRPDERLDEARRRLAGFAGTADEALRTRSSAAGPLLDGLALLAQRLGTELTRVDDDAAPVVQNLLQDLDRAVRTAAAVTGTHGRTAPAPWAPSGVDDATAAVRYAQEAAEAAQEAAHATARARLAAHRAWEAKAAAVTATRAAQQDADTAEQDARAAQELTRTARENARQARERAQAAQEQTRTAREETQAAQEQTRTAREETQAAQERARTAREEARQADEQAQTAQEEARQAQDEAETHGREMVGAEARAEEARLREAAAHREAAEAVRAAEAAQAQADAAEGAAAEQREVRAAAEERMRQARAEAERENRYREEAEAESVRAESARQEARRARFRAELRLSADLIWDRYRDPAFAFGTEEPPADADAGALWSRVHVALLRLTEPDRLREAAALAALARRCGLEPGGITPGEPAGPGQTVVAVPALPEYGIGELWLRTDVPRWADLTVDERTEVTTLLESARAEEEGGSQDRLAALLPSPQDDDLLLTALLRIWQADRLIALDAGLGRWPDARKRRWIPWAREDFRKQAVHQLALLASVYPEPVTGWTWARPEDAQTAVAWLHSLDAVLGFHHRAPALRGSWWWSWRLALAAELVHPAGWAGRRAVVDPDELTRLFAGPRSKDYFEQPDVCDRVDPPVQWLASPPLVATDEEGTPRCLRKGRIVRGVGRD